MKITITGPAGSGKGTIARHIAKRYGVTHVDAGLVFRAIGYAMSEYLIRSVDEFSFAKDSPWRYLCENGELTIYLHGRPLREALGTEEVGMQAARLASDRDSILYMLSVVNDLADKFDRMVLDGRSAGSTLIRDADWRFYLEGDQEVRATRRFMQLRERDPHLTLGQVLAGIRQRDILDQCREFDPLRRLEGMHVIDTTHLTPEETLRRVAGILETSIVL